MARRMEDLAAEAVALPTDDRLALFQAIAKTLQPPTDDPCTTAWLDEAERRWDEMEAGIDPGTPAEEVLARMRSSARR